MCVYVSVGCVIFGSIHFYINEVDYSCIGKRFELLMCSNVVCDVMPSIVSDLCKLHPNYQEFPIK